MPMLLVLSPAKSLDYERDAPEIAVTQPAFLDEAETLAARAAKLKPDALRALMHISQPLADLNAGRFRAFSRPFTRENAKPAIYAFNGDVYLGFDVGSLDQAAIAFAQSHVRILSGLYGVLRPLDLMQPYRLEMGTKFKVGRKPDLYAYWGDRLTRHLAAELDGAPLVNLASQEYFSAVQAKKLPGGVITLHFKEIRDGQPRIISFFAKKARGAMARFACAHAIDRPDGLKDFTSGGYRFQSSLSGERDWVFTRPGEAAA